jgi:transposase InsO family protein
VDADRQWAQELIAEAVSEGARCEKACEILGISKRTYMRWKQSGAGDQRRGPKSKPQNALSEAEMDLIVEVMNSPIFRDKTPAEIVPILADKEIYLASERTMYRILAERAMLSHREGSRPRRHKKPKEHVATGPNQVWSWDITYLKSPIRGQFYYLYMVVDVWSRKIVGWAVHERECSWLATQLILDACRRHGVIYEQLIIHSDNGPAMKGATLTATLQKLGIIPSYSRPRVCDDNPYSEALFKTLKYRPGYPSLPFESRDHAEWWVEDFVQWYNHEHLHSGIRYVTPADRHDGKDKEILKNRTKVYEEAKDRNPDRWSGVTRNWEPIAEVRLNSNKHYKDSDVINEEICA